MTSLKISPDQLQRIKQARIERGWAIDHPDWLIEASKILKPSTDWEKGEKLAVSIGSWKRFLNGKPIKTDVFKAFCQILDLQWRELIDSTVVQVNRSVMCDWGEAPDPSVLVGRVAEIATLQQWMNVDRVRLVSVLGVGGMGKTLLASKVAHNMAGDYHYIIWRSLSEAPPVDQFVSECIQFISTHRANGQSSAGSIAADKQAIVDLPATLGQKITRLIDLLQSSKCLIILDNVESILQSGAFTGNYQLQYKGYGELLRRVCETLHQSCLLLTSREQIRDLRRLQGSLSSARVMKLGGLNQEAVQILNTRGVFASAQEMDTLISKYHGNPLVLEMVSATIKDTFNNDIADFLKIPGLFGEVKDLVMSQSYRLSEVEKMVICWLAEYQKTATCHQIAANLPNASHVTIIEALDSLVDRSLVLRMEEGFILPEMVMEYVNELYLA
jgi:hypothetical protein